MRELWKDVNSILLDTGCSRMMVRRRLVPRDKFLEGKWVSIRCVHGDTVLYPLADVQLVVEGITVKVEAAVAESLPVEVILGIDASSMTELLGRRAGSVFFAQEDVMVVTTRAKRRQELQKGILKKEKEVMSGVVTNHVGDSEEESSYVWCCNKSCR